MRFLSTAARGQSLAEATIFLPIVLLAMFGTIYVGQYGVLAERTQLAVRYGGLIGDTSIFSAAAIYDFYSLPNGSLPPCPSPPPGIVIDGAPLPGPVSAPYWQPASVTTSCVGVAHSVGGAQFLASHIFAASQATVTTQLTVVPFLSGVVGPTATVGASEPFAHAADPSTILYCSKEVNRRVRDAVFGALTPATPAPTAAPSASPAPLAFAC